MSVLSWALLLITTSSIVSGVFLNPYPRFRLSESANSGETVQLSNYLKRNDTNSAKRYSRVSFPGNDLIESYSGYLTGDNITKSHLFFWYFPVASRTRDHRPLLVWLEGGPGSSSAAHSVLAHSGPYQFSGQQVSPREISWNANYSVLYIDSQVGSGFSYTESATGFPRNYKIIANHLYEVIRQFFQIFPEMKNRKLFIGGESNGGRCAIALGNLIKKNNVHVRKEKMNLKGLILGSTLIDPMHQLDYGEYYFNLGLLDQNGRMAFKKSEKDGLNFIKRHEYEAALNSFDDMLSIDRTKSSLFSNLTGHASHLNYQKPARDDVNEQLGRYLQSSNFRRIIHVGNQRYQMAQRDNEAERQLAPEMMKSMTSWLMEVLLLNRVLVYTGQLDLLTPYPLMSRALQKLKYTNRVNFRTAPRAVWKISNEIAGYAREGGNISEVVIRNAGHFAIADKPRSVIDMIIRFTDELGFFRNT